MPKVASHPQGRPTKAERGAATRTRLLDATLDSLVELGWSGTSTTEVVRRAGVSRGAQVHHYPSKEDLVLAAVEHLGKRRMEEYRSVFQGLPAEKRTPDAALDLLWDMWSGPKSEAWLELAVGARTRPLLHQRFVDFERRFFDAALALYQETQPEAAADPAFARLALHFSFCLLNGMDVGRLVGTDPAELRDVLEAFKVIAASFTLSDQGVAP